ncbi:MAG: PAS domain-containing protein [Clostridiales bacterium]|nr:PAS domain-containing protein [Clostridiales bacterium]
MTAKIFKNTCLVGLSVLLLCAAVFFGLQYTQTKEETYDALRQEAVYAANGIALSGEKYLETLDNEHRITWIDRDGTVLYDSEFGGSVGNQSHLPEVAAAREAGEGQSIRKSESSGQSTMYCAVLCEDGTVLRLSRPLSAFRYALHAVSPVLWVVVLVLLVSGALAFRVSKQILAPVNAIDLDHPDASKAYPELAPLVGRIEEQNLTIREREEELLARQREFTTLTDSMSEGFLLLDKNGVILSANSEALQLFRDAQEGDTFPETPASAASEAVRDALEGKRTETRLETDNARTMRIIASPILQKGRLSGAVILTVDVTEQEQREQLRREFSANVSHELKTPLTSISGFAELLMRGMVSPDMTAEFASDIYKESQRMIALVDDIIKLSKLDEEGVSYEWETVELGDLAADVLDTLRSAADKRGITMTLTGSGQVRGVWRILNEMVYNLCDNAIKYNKDGGLVDVEIADEGSDVTLTVRDTGIGIPDAHRDRVFERFYRVDKSHSREIGGTGLGLSIVKHGALLHHAAVSLESEVGEGTAVTLRFRKDG